jgi:hypothetical protein
MLLAKSFHATKHNAGKLLHYTRSVARTLPYASLVVFLDLFVNSQASVSGAAFRVLARGQFRNAEANDPSRFLHSRPPRHYVLTPRTTTHRYSSSLLILLHFWTPEDLTWVYWLRRLVQRLRTSILRPRSV